MTSLVLEYVASFISRLGNDTIGETTVNKSAANVTPSRATPANLRNRGPPERKVPLMTKRKARGWGWTETESEERQVYKYCSNTGENVGAVKVAVCFQIVPLLSIGEGL